MAAGVFPWLVSVTRVPFGGSTVDTADHDRRVSGL